MTEKSVTHPIRPICTCYFGRLCLSTHKTWEEFHDDKELIQYCYETFGYACPHCGASHTGQNPDDIRAKIDVCKGIYRRVI